MIILLVLLGLLLVLMVLRVPVAFGVGIASLVVLIWQGDLSLAIVPNRVLDKLNIWPLIAIPLFILAGKLMTEGGLTERLVSFSDAIVGWVRGGLAQVAVLSNVFMAGISGSSLADAAATGSVMIPAMTRNGYPAAYAAALCAAAAAIGPIIPPSIGFVVYGMLADVSVGKLFLAGVIPGFVVALALMVMVAVQARRRGFPASTLPTLGHLGRTTVRAWPALIMPGIVVGGFVLGLFTVTEASAVAVAWALVAGAAAYAELGFRNLYRALVETARQSAALMFTIAMAGIFSYLVAYYRLGDGLTEALQRTTQSAVVLLMLVNVFLFLAGMVMDVTEIMIIFIPILKPVIAAYRIDPVHFGVILVLNLQLGLLTPPYGLSMFLMCRLANISVPAFVVESLPMLASVGVALLIVTYWPAMVLFLPNLLR